MDEKDKQLINERYNQRFGNYGANIKALASGNIERQKIRFNVITQVGITNNSTVLDIGCGFADYYDYLKQEGIQIQYTGYDINSNFIKICRKRYPEASFEITDIQNMTLTNKYDYVISSQVFNNKLVKDDNEEIIRDVIKKSYEICTKGVAIDMLTKYVDFMKDGLYYYSPEEIFKFCKTLTKRVVLRHDYPLYEFMIYLYKDFKGWA